MTQTSKSSLKVEGKHTAPLTVVHLFLNNKVWGVEQYAIDLIFELDKLGVKNHALIAADGEPSTLLNTAGISTSVVRMRGYFDFVAARKIWDECQKLNADILHAHMGVDSFLAVMSGVNESIAIIKSVHFVDPAYVSKPFLIREIWRLVQMVKNRSVSHFLPVSKMAASRLYRRERVPAERITIVNPGRRTIDAITPESRAAARKDEQIPDDAFVLSAVSRLSPEKGIDVLLRAMPTVLSKIPAALVLIAGSGDQEGELRELADSLGISHCVRFLGRRSDAIERILPCTDLFISPSREESFGIAVVEAMMSGLPVIVSDCAGRDEIAQDGKSGLLTVPGDHYDLADKILRMYSDPELRAGLAAEGRQRALLHFTSERMARNVLSVYSRVLGSRRRLRVAHLILGQRVWGVERYVLNLQDGLKDHRTESFVFCASEEVAPVFRDAGCRTETLDMRGYLDLRSMFRLFGRLRELEIDVLHAHLGVDSFLGTLVALAVGIPVVQSVHFDHPAYESKPILIRESWRLVQAVKNRFIAKFLAITANVRDELIQREHVEVDKIAVIPPGIPIRSGVPEETRKATRAQFTSANDSYIIVSVGRLAREKAMDILVKAAKLVTERCQHCEFWIVGEGNQREALEQLIAELSLEHVVKLLGYQPNAGEIAAAADVFVLPSREEPFGIAAVEAMMAGVPTIGSRTSGLQTIIVNRESGLLFDPDQPEQLAEAIIELLTDRPLAEKLALAGQTRASTLFTSARMAEDIAAIYHEVTKGKKRKARPLSPQLGANPSLSER